MCLMFLINWDENVPSRSIGICKSRVLLGLLSVFLLLRLRLLVKQVYSFLSKPKYSRSLAFKVDSIVSFFKHSRKFIEIFSILILTAHSCASY